MNGRTGRKTGDTAVGNFGEDRFDCKGERLIELCTYAVAQWLRCCVTNPEVAGSIPDGVIGIFH